MLLTEYETTLVVRPDLGTDVIETTLDRVRESVRVLGGKLLAINHWGKKKLAYPIMKHTRGIYVHTQYLGNGKVVAEIERNLRNADSVLRYLTVMVEKNVDPTSREEKEYVVPQLEAIEEISAAEEMPGADRGDELRSTLGEDGDDGFDDHLDGDEGDLAGEASDSEEN